MSKFLNLDEVAAKEERVLRFRGDEYEMRAMSVSDFIEITREAEKLDAKGEIGVVEQTEMLVKMVGSAFPTMSKELLGSMNFDQLTAVLDFIRNVSEENAEGEEGKK